MRSLFTTIAILTLGTVMSAQPKVHYILSMPEPSTHIFEVRMTVSGLDTGDETLDLSMAAWRTGRYIILDFAGGVVDFAAEDPRGNVLPWKKTDKQTWSVEKHEQTSVIVTYKVYANEFDLRTRGLNDEHAFVDPVAVFMYLPDQNDIPLTLTVNPYGSWHVTTGLDEVPGRPFTYTAPTFEYFADCPLEIGNHADYAFQHGGKEHVWMIAGDADYDIDRIIADTKKIISENLKFWGQLPYERYIFMLHISPGSGGGTEHLNSTIMGTRPFTFQNDRSYRGFLGLVSHEYFHTWNVKQLRPAGITPYDFSKENYSEELWLAEGGTSFFDEIILLRAGFGDVDEYLRGLGRDIEQDRQRPGNRKQSVTESSYDAWIKFWRQRENSYNAESDYYGKGKLATMLLSLELLKRTDGRASMEDVMRAMFERFPVFKKGYTVGDLREICEEFAGGPMEDFFRDYIYGTKDYPWEEAFSVIGLQVRPDEAEPKATLGLWTSDGPEGAKVRMVVEGGAAYAAGISPGDVIVAVDGYKARSADLSARASERRPGDRMTLTVFRDDMLRSVEVVLGKDPVPSYTVSRVGDPSDIQKRSYETFFGFGWPQK